MQTFEVFCIDVYHEIAPPLNNAAYTMIPLSSDDFGTGGSTLSSTQVQEIGEVATYGSNLISTAGTTNLDARLAGVQDAIWDIEYPNAPYVFKANDTEAATYEANDVNYVETNPLSSAIFYAIIPDGGNTQAFVCPGCSPGGGSLGGGAGAVPEPASWTLMILGVSAMGAALRKGRRTRIA